MTDDIQPAAAPAATTPVPSGLGGWLILPMLGLILSALGQVIALPDIFATFGQLGLSGVGGLASNLVQLDILLALALYFVAPIALLVLMLGKKRSFPRNFIRWAIAAAILVVFDLLLGYWLGHAALEASGEGFFGYATLREAIAPLAGLVIWTPYMLNSLRVKNTFVN